MKNLLLVCILIASISGCNKEDCGAASCLAPPDGDFTEGKYNIAIYETVSDGSDQIRMDSVILSAETDILIKDFYTWVAVENPRQVSLFTLYSGENQYVINDILPELNGDQKGYLIGFFKDEDTFLINGIQASKDLINGICNDTINC